MNKLNSTCEEPSALEQEVLNLRYRRDMLEMSCKEAWNQMMFSYQFFEEDRSHFRRLSLHHKELDRQLAELDGRLKKCKSKMDPKEKKQSKPTTSNSMTKEKLINYLKGLTQAEKEVFLERFKTAFEKEGTN